MTEPVELWLEKLLRVRQNAASRLITRFIRAYIVEKKRREEEEKRRKKETPGKGEEPTDGSQDGYGEVY